MTNLNCSAAMKTIMPGACKLSYVSCLKSLTADILYVVKKRHEQVEKTLEMKKWSRNGSSNETR